MKKILLAIFLTFGFIGAVQADELGFTKLKQLKDVSIPTPNDNDSLTYDTATGKWVAEAVVGGSGSNYWSLAPGNVGINTTNNVGLGTISPVGKLIVMGGNVGIGTPTPSATLAVSGTMNFNPTAGTQQYLLTGRTNTLGLQGLSSSTSSNLELYAKDGDGTDNVGYVVWGKGVPSDVTNSEYLEAAYKTASSTFDINAQNIGGGTLRNMRLYTGSNVSQVVVASSGNVGINSATPGTQLDVAGTVRSTAETTGTITTTGNVGLGTTLNTDGRLIVRGGNVGLGTDHPGQVLDVNGTAQMTGFKLTTNPSASYVLTSNSLGIGTWMPSTGGVTSVAKSGSSAITGAVTLSQGSNITLTQVGNDIAIASTGGGSSQWLNEAGNVGINTTVGNVGIGTLTTKAKLTILGNIGVGTVAGDAYISTAPPLGGALFGGNIGIGTVSPAALLSLSSNDEGGIDINTNDTSGTSTSADYLIVAGGGGGCGGGGGGGGVLTGTTTLTSGQNSTITIGNGGSGCPNVNSGGGNNGQDSIALSLTATGGGKGGDTTTTSPGRNGFNGGSGGGGGQWNGGTTNGGTGSQGNNGGTNGGFTSSPFPGGGGGGGGAVGANAPNSTTSGNGGAGLASSISGASVTYAGGGGGGTFFCGTPGTGGAGGGGDGKCSVAGVNGTANTGGGGGGTGEDAGDKVGGTGGSGVAIISYTTAGVTEGTGGTITHSGGKTIHTFTSSGTFIGPTFNNSSRSRLKFKSGGLTKWSMNSDGTNSFNFTVSNGDLGTNDYFTVDVNGNVGIGTTKPLTRFAVWNGNVGIGTFASSNARLTVIGGNVGVGTVMPLATMEVKGTFSVRGASTSPFTVKSGANTACDTTCGTSQCVAGEDTIGLTFLNCSNATADVCICAGP